MKTKYLLTLTILLSIYTINGNCMAYTLPIIEENGRQKQIFKVPTPDSFAQ